MRASYYLIGALLARYKKAEVGNARAGCNFGKRPIDLHLKGFRALGATVIEEDGMVKAYAEKLIGTSIYMDQVSVGATINVHACGNLAEGTTRLKRGEGAACGRYGKLSEHDGCKYQGRRDRCDSH